MNDNEEKVMSEMTGYPVENCIVRVPMVEQKAETPKTKSAKPKKEAKPKEAKLKPVTAVKDDLTKIEGIGKKIEALLYKNKISSYKQLSKSTVTSLKAILDAAGSKFAMHNPGSWPKQAKLAAEGKWDDLELLQKHLKGGK